MARWFGLRVFDAAIMVLTEDNEVDFAGGGKAAPGPAFLTRAEAGFPWSGEASQLELLENRQDLTRLIVFDTWVRNCDRYLKTPGETRRNKDNVFLSQEGCSKGKLALVAMDHSHCFTCGRELTPRLADIGTVRDERLHGAFPEFGPYFDMVSLGDCLQRLSGVTQSVVSKPIDSIPREWEVSDAARSALKRFLTERAAYLCEKSADFFRR